MTETKTIGSMTDRQRRTLAAMLETQASPIRAAAGALRDEVLA
jgi:hypothetical protein